jgi:hypothetical protein
MSCMRARAYVCECVCGYVCSHYIVITARIFLVDSYLWCSLYLFCTCATEWPVTKYMIIWRQFQYQTIYIRVGQSARYYSRGKKGGAKWIINYNCNNMFYANNYDNVLCGECVSNRRHLQIDCIHVSHSVSPSKSRILVVCASRSSEEYNHNVPVAVIKATQNVITA